MPSNPETRKGNTPLKVYCLPDERRRIQAGAAAAGLSVSAYLLHIGLGDAVAGVLDPDEMMALQTLSHDLERLKELLALWQARDGHVAIVTARSLLKIRARIAANQAALTAITDKTAAGTPPARRRFR
jgi:hypothetical protein